MREIGTSERVSGARTTEAYTCHAEQGDTPGVFKNDQSGGNAALVSGLCRPCPDQGGCEESDGDTRHGDCRWCDQESRQVVDV